MRVWMTGVVACVLLMGCGGAAADAVGAASPPVTATPSATPTSTPAPSPTPSTPTHQRTAPLTGEPVDDPATATRPVLALKIDNHPRARPPTALEQADIVFEEMVEGGVTRFVALYHSEVPNEVGPVRSGREVDADLLPAFDPVLGMSGAAPVVYGVLWGAGLKVFEEGQAEGFFRRSDLPAPHNLMARPANLFQAGEDLPSAAVPWPIEGDVPPGGRSVSRARLDLSEHARADWSWDATTRRWLRSQDGAAHRDASGGRQMADNVVIVEVATRPGTRTDAGGHPTVEIDVIGEGDATILRNGRAYTARWRKDGPKEQFEWTTVSGETLPLAPGRTWIELAPQTGSLMLF